MGVKEKDPESTGFRIIPPLALISGMTGDRRSGPINRITSSFFLPLLRGEDKRWG